MDDGNSMFDVRENTSVIKECSFDLERSAQIIFFFWGSDDQFNKRIGRAELIITSRVIRRVKYQVEC